MLYQYIRWIAATFIVFFLLGAGLFATLVN